jgi:hypothetical protein
MSTLEERYELIRRRDELFAYDLAKGVIEKPKASVWIIFLPLLFVFYVQKLQKHKKDVQGFVNHYLQTKVLALEAALDEVRSGSPPASSIVSGSDDPSADGAIRRTQYHELDLLREHYLLLLRSRGGSYAELVKTAYGMSGTYRFFLNRLRRAEGEVNRAVLEAHHPTPEARDVAERMERFSEQLREMEMERIFG